jgi:hypothetical protein
VSWDATLAKLNTATIKNPRMGAKPLIIRVGLTDTIVTGQLDTSRWRQIKYGDVDLRHCDAVAEFLEHEFAPTDAKENDRIVDGTQEYLMTSVEPDGNGVVSVWLRKLMA